MMPKRHTRRQFISQSAVTVGCLLAGKWRPALADEKPVTSTARVVIARDEKITRGKLDEHQDLLIRLLNASMQKLFGVEDPVLAWQRLFSPTDRVGIKVNTLGFSTRPQVVNAIVAGLRLADVRPENIIIWDRFDVELAKAGFKISKSGDQVRCYGTDAERYGSGYLPKVEISGEIGSCFSRIVAAQVDKLICVPILKDHNLAGVSLGLKNWYGAIHNPNKYHEHNCDPYIADVAGHRYIRPKWKLTVCDAITAQYNAGPQRHEDYVWPFGGLIVGHDIVAVDAVGADILEKERAAKGLKPLARDRRPTVHIATAAARGMGTADLNKIERIEV